jgi:hypothetical protein
MKKYFVYVHTRPDKIGINSIFYVGKGTETRVNYLHRKQNKFHSRVVDKIGKENIKIKRIECDSEQHALDMEILIISILKRLGVQLCNMTDGGEGLSGFRPTAETRNKMSISGKNVQGSEHSRAIKSKNTKISWENEETRIKRTNSIRAARKTNESRLKQSIISKKRYENQSERDRQSRISKEIHSSPEYKIKFSEIMKKINGTNESRQKRSEITKLSWKNEEIRKKRLQALSSIETRAKMSASAKLARTPEFRAKQSIMQSTPEAKSKRSAAAKLMWKKRKEKLKKEFVQLDLF